MAIGAHRLSNRFVNTVTKAAMYNDGEGLYLQVGEGGNAKSWIFRYSNSRFGKAGKTEMGLGPVHTFSLDEARELARICRQQLKNGINPLEARQAERAAKRLEESKHVMFRECAVEWIDFMTKRRGKKGWEPKTAKTTKRRIEKHLYPSLADLPIGMIDVDQCFRTLQPILERTQVMAIHVHMYLKGILDRAKARGFRTGDNPADLDGPLGILMPELRGDARDIEHAPSLPYQKLGAFMAQLRTPREVGTTAYTLKEAAEVTGYDRSVFINAISDGRLKAFKKPGTEALNTINSPWFVEPTELRKAGYPLKNTLDPRPFIPLVAYLIQFQILTAARPTEARLMRWDEAPDWEETELWLIPWYRHKIGKQTKKPIYKPLSAPAIAILKAMKAAQEADGIASDFVFAQGNSARLSESFGKPMSDATERKYLARFFDPNEASLQGFRSTFSSWAYDQGRFDPQDIERALGHIKGEGMNEVARIYNRDAKRLQPLTQLMDAWADFCGRTEPLPADVIPFRQAKVIGDSHE